MKTTLTFEIDVEGDRAAALDRRDEIIDALKAHGMDLVLTDDGTRIVMYDHGEAYGVARRQSHGIQIGDGNTQVNQFGHNE